MKKVIFSALLILINIAAFSQSQMQHVQQAQQITVRQVLESKDTILMNDIFGKEILPQLMAVDTTKYSKTIIKPKSYTMAAMIRDSTLASQFKLNGVTIEDFATIFYNYRHGSLGDTPVSPYGNVVFLQCRTGQYAGEYIILLAYNVKYRKWSLEAYRYDGKTKVVFAKNVQVLSSM